MEYTEALREILGKNVIFDSVEKIPYMSDASAFNGKEPIAVALPETVDEVKRLLAFCNSNKIFVVPRGGGTSLTGASIPLENFIVLSMAKFNRILSISPADRYVVAEPGLRLDELNDKLSEINFFYPPDPASSMAATVGGSISTNAGGLRASMYGTTKEWVLGLEVVLPDGSSMTTGGRVLKRSAGYDLTALFVGAEGTLGVITKAFLKIWPKPEATGRILAYYDTIEKIGLAIRNIKASGITPLIAEFLDRITMDSLNKAKGMSFPEAASYMLILDVASTELSIAGDLERTANMLRELNPIEISITRDPDEMARIYEARKGAYSSLLKVRKSSNQRVIIGDVVVPASELPAALKEIAGRAEELGIMVALFGHISDGNIHANIFAEPGNAESMSKEEEFQKHLGRVALEHGGSVSAEHGIGIEKKNLLLDQEKFTSSEEAIDIMRKIKHAFDPNGIMNRGKIFD